MLGNQPLRIVLTGAECTGKSTITSRAANHFEEPFSQEYVRHYVEKLDRPLEEKDLDPIFRGQLQFEDQAFAEARHYVFHDTNLISSILYADHYFNFRRNWMKETFRKREYAAYFLCEPDIPWQVDPGQRESPEERLKLQRLFEEILERYSIPYIRLRGSIEDRLNLIVQHLRDLG